MIKCKKLSNCSFDCLDCCYGTNIRYNDFKDLYKLITLELKEKNK